MNTATTSPAPRIAPQALPLPADGDDAWDDAAAEVARAHAAPDGAGRRSALVRAARASLRAYDLDGTALGDDLLAWWEDRLPR